MQPITPYFSIRAERFKELARQKAERDAELPPWQPAEVVAFEKSHVVSVKTGTDLLRLALVVLDDINVRLTSGDVTSRPLLERATDEDEVQNWLVEQMNFVAKDRYHAHREAQVADDDKPDVIISSTSAPVQVAIEIKHGGKGWTLRQLEAALKQQLAVNYLKPSTRRHGILVVTHHRDRKWVDRKSRKPMTFENLIERLSSIAATLDHDAFGAIDVKCVGINAWRPIAAGETKKVPARRITRSWSRSLSARKTHKRSSRSKR